MKRKILFVITKSNWGGAQRYVYDLATHLPADRYESVVATGGQGILTEKLTAKGIFTVSVPTLVRDISFGKEVSSFFALLSLFKSVRPSIIHLNSSKAGGIGAAAAWLYRKMPGNSRPRVIFTAHGWGFNEPRPFYERAAIYGASVLMSLFLDTVICITKSGTRSAKRFMPEQKVAFIPNGIEPFELESRTDARNALSRLSRRPIADTDIVFGTNAEFTKNKGYADLLNALTALSKTTKGWKSIWISDGELRPALEKEIRSRGLEHIILCTGFIEDAKRYLSAFDAFVLPSLKEGLPYTILEAMRAGVPAIGTRVGGIPDLIEHAVSGILVPPARPDALLKALQEFLKDKTRGSALATRARMNVEQRYTLERMIQETRFHYEKK